ncbi:hypothetical protein AAC387_Pa05g2231 [Persea americana]
MGCFNTLTSRSPPIATAATTTSSVSQGGVNGAARSESLNSTSTPRSSDGASSSTVDLIKEYTMSVQTSSYNEIWARIHEHSLSEVQVLNPDRDSVNKALQIALPNKLTRVVSDYFDSSEDTSKLCLLLQQSINQARSIYLPIGDLIEHLPSSSSSTSQPQCDWAFDTLTEFHRQENPFPSDTNFDHIRLSQLKLQLDQRLRKARSRTRLIRRTTRGSAICLIGSVAGVAVSAVVVATHALTALVAIPFFTFLPSNFAKQQLHHISQLDAAAKGTYVLHNDLYTIDRLVARLHATVESDKELIRYGLERGKDKYPIVEVVKQLRKNHPHFLHQLKDLEEHVCLCFTTVNRARSLLLEEIHLHQTRNSQQHYTCFGGG